MLELICGAASGERGGPGLGVFRLGRGGAVRVDGALHQLVHIKLERGQERGRWAEGGRERERDVCVLLRETVKRKSHTISITEACTRTGGRNSQTCVSGRFHVFLRNVAACAVE